MLYGLTEILRLIEPEYGDLGIGTLLSSNNKDAID